MHIYVAFEVLSAQVIRLPLNFSVSLWKRSQLSNVTTWGHPDRPKKFKNLTDTSGSYSLPHPGNGQIPHFADTSVMVKCSGFAPWGGGEGGGGALKFRIDRRLTAVGLSMVGGFQGSKVQLISSGWKIKMFEII